MEMLEDPETGKKQREGRRCLSRAANIDKAGPPPSLPSSGAHHKSPEKKGGASPKHQWKREWAGSRLGAGGGACPAGPMRTRGAGRLLGREGRRMADAALFEFLHTEMVAELWAQDPDPGPGGQKMSLSVLEGMGFRVGQALGERLPRETLAFREELDALKFLCKDVWAAVFQKQMDSLRTNHQGTYVLQDHSFPLLIRMASGLQYLEEAPKFLAFTCGLLRGTLSTLGIKSLVTASVAALPACKFQVVIQRS
ncbi:trafficking protein particle complex subunit 6A isoform X2 [Globicephala melas]|uniref:trafficking protein particle complex subunit 6A isoform X2 n=2 Tax=Delphinidae TaxID=9726 RepID=UPI00122EB8C7|nr:trafficking protein particle complex subunit 6A isoform X2 [Globicephala melas]